MRMVFLKSYKQSSDYRPIRLYRHSSGLANFRYRRPPVVIGHPERAQAIVKVTVPKRAVISSIRLKLGTTASLLGIAGTGTGVGVLNLLWSRRLNDFVGGFWSQGLSLYGGRFWEGGRDHRIEKCADVLMFRIRTFEHGCGLAEHIHHLLIAQDAAGVV